jgi:hypothetical protein
VPADVPPIPDLEAPVTTAPHDVSDLYLAPLLLALDARLEELGQLDSEDLSRQVALVSDQPDWTRELRESGLLRAVQHFIDCHHWELSWDPRGLRVAHASRHLVLGLPANLVEYLAGSASHSDETSADIA